MVFRKRKEHLKRSERFQMKELIAYRESEKILGVGVQIKTLQKSAIIGKFISMQICKLTQ